MYSIVGCWLSVDKSELKEVTIVWLTGLYGEAKSMKWVFLYWIPLRVQFMVDPWSLLLLVVIMRANFSGFSRSGEENQAIRQSGNINHEHVLYLACLTEKSVQSDRHHSLMALYSRRCCASCVWMVCGLPVLLFVPIEMLWDLLRLRCSSSVRTDNSDILSNDHGSDWFAQCRLCNSHPWIVENNWRTWAHSLSAKIVRWTMVWCFPAMLVPGNTITGGGIFY